MQPHPRIRKTIKWGGLALTVLLVVVWIGSGWWSIQRVSPNRFFYVGFGGFGCTPPGARPFFVSEGWEIVRTRWAERKWFQLNLMPSHEWKGWFMPLWPFVCPIFIATSLGWAWDSIARRRAARFNRCPRCRYDRSGLAAGAVCPECGAEAPGGAA